MKNRERDNECKYRDLCEEIYGNEKSFSCGGIEKCKHYDTYLEGECVAFESEF